MKIRYTTVNLPVIFYKEGNNFIAYTPALDLSTCGSTIEKAKKRFEAAIDIFLTETYKMGTLEDVLIENGWKKVSRPKKHWIPPRILFQEQEQIEIPCPT